MTTSPPAPRDGAKAPAKKAAKAPSATAAKAAPPAKKAVRARKVAPVVTEPAKPEIAEESAPAAKAEPKPAAVVPLRAVPAPPASASPAPAEEKKKPGVGALLLAAFRNGQSAIARAVGLVALIVGVVIIVGIALVLGGANPHNGLVKALYGLDGALVHPFAGDLHQPMTTAYIHNQQAVFGPKTIKKFVLENWGLATVVYLGAGLLLARLVRFGKA